MRLRGKEPSCKTYYFSNDGPEDRRGLRRRTPVEKPLKLDGVDSAATKEEVKKSVLFAQSWHEATYAKRQYLFALTDGPADSASYIDLHGWIYNKSF